MKKYLVNYSDKTHKNAQIENSKSTISIGEVPHQMLKTI